MLRAIVILLAVFLAPPLAAQDGWDHAFRPLPFHDAAVRVTARYQGRLIAAAPKPPTPDEMELGAQLVYEFRLLTPARHLLVIRMDARDGRFLDVAGQGQLQARRKGT
ncbi:PepSY domain-containing protein [Paracoccus sp. (in: a-proteobacteria)]|uniref:PepSY domain-containing protein n=1 Tax=Paracoccus sp. TaxID=267 RepID=UPI0026E0179A|nr:hypothetical protein [Paracoccus sp. (in: a-proteobacteria)]MDO5646818.1 hypothetical protein [Paracoccus sp. (in: a-proteobacteria)]